MTTLGVAAASANEESPAMAWDEAALKEPPSGLAHFDIFSFAFFFVYFLFSKSIQILYKFYDLEFFRFQNIFIFGERSNLKKQNSNKLKYGKK